MDISFGNRSSEREIGQRVILSAEAPRRGGQGRVQGTYRSHFVAEAHQVIPAPDCIPDAQLGTLWLSYLTAWGCLVWKENLGAGKVVALSAASSSAALAAAQMVRELGSTPIGLTSSPEKVDLLREMPEAVYEEILPTRDPDGSERPWHRDLKSLTGGVDLCYDAVAAGEYLQKELSALNEHGTIWIYGLLGEPDQVDVTPLIRKFASIRGWALTELIQAGFEAMAPGYQHILERIETGAYRQKIAGTFPLRDVQHAHREMELGKHIGKLALEP